MNKILKLLAEATELIKKLNDIITQHDIEINELTNKVKELEHGKSAN